MEVLTREDPSVKEVTGIIKTDPAFTSELLRVANSALYGFSYQINTVQHAIVTLGLEFVKALSMTVAMRSYLKQAMRLPALRRCWRHSLASALLSEELATACQVPADGAYTGGLLHDIGRLALLVAYPKEYANLLEVSAENSFDLLATERDLFDVDHCEAGLWLSAEWKLPKELIQVICNHHDAPQPGNFDLAALVRQACRLADVMDFGVIRYRKPPSLEEIREELPEPGRTRFNPDMEWLKSMVAMRIDALD
jgi:putative nucleotidyltransferase with HDIG domain